MSRASLEAAIPAGSGILLDASAVLAYLDGTEATSAAANVVLDELVRPGRNPATISAATVTEILVRPFRAGSAAVAIVEAFLRHFPNVVTEPVDHEVAREAARLCAATGIRTPDALVLATASVRGIPVVVANDDRWLGVIERALPSVALCRLGAHVEG